jgi:recombination protein RecA
MDTDKDLERTLDLAISQIEKQFGKGALIKLGEDAVIRDISTISTGSLSLDLALGIGGLPHGRVAEIYGPEAFGKTTMALHVVARAQKGGGICAYMRCRACPEPRLCAQTWGQSQGVVHFPT